MANAELRTFYVNGFKGGWQPDLPLTQLQPDMIPELMNVNWGEGYALTKRGGYEMYGQSYTPYGGGAQAAMTLAADTVFFPRVFTASGEHPNFTQRVMYLAEPNSKLFYQTFGNIVDESVPFVNSGQILGDLPGPTAVNYFRCWSAQCVTYGSKIYITALRFNGKSADGATVETDDGTTGASGPSKPIIFDAQAGTFSRPIVHPLDDSGTGFPAARACIVKYDRIFAANLYKKGVYRYPSRVYWNGDEATGNFDAQKWMSENFIEVGGDDGSEITSLLPFGEQILVFKNTSVWALTGSSAPTFTLYQLDATLGSEATFGTVAAAGAAYFFDHRSGVWAYDGARFTNISEPINGYMLDLLNQESAFKAVLTYHNQKLYLSVPTLFKDWDEESDPADFATHTFVYDTKLAVWTQWDIGWTGVPAEYFTDYNVAGLGLQAEGHFYTAGTGYYDPVLDDFFRAIGVHKQEHGRLNSDHVIPDDNMEDGRPIAASFKTAWWNPGNTGDRHRIRRLEMLFEPDTFAEVDLYRDLSNERAVPWSAQFHSAGNVDNGLGDAPIESHYSDPGRDIGLWTWLQAHVHDDNIDTPFQVNGISMVVSDRPRQRGFVRCFEPLIYDENSLNDPGFEEYLAKHGGVAELKFRNILTSAGEQGIDWIQNTGQVAASTPWTIVTTSPDTGLYHARMAYSYNGVGGSMSNALEYVQYPRCIDTPKNGFGARVAPGRSVVFSARVKVDSMTGDPRFYMEVDSFKDFYPRGDTFFVAVTPQLTTPSTSWATYTLSFDVPTGVSVLRVFIIPASLGNNFGTRTFDVDNLSFVMAS